MITSTVNTHVKRIRALAASRRTRDDEQCFVLEGVRLVAEAVAARARLQLVLYDPHQLAATDEGRQLATHLEAQPYCYPATPRVIGAATDTVTPQGVVAVAERPALPPASGLWLVLDRLQDPGNLGTLLRSAEAAGVGRVVCNRGTVDAYSPKVVRSAMGAHFSLPLLTSCTDEEIADMLRGVPRIYAAVSEARLPYDRADWSLPAALLVGNEAQGIGYTLLALATDTVAIPMAGRLASLNAAVAGSILLFEALRHNRPPAS